MACMKFFFFMVLFLYLEYIKVEGTDIETDSFYVSFQRSRALSTEEWIEYKGKMPDLKEFSVCHWDRPTSFNDNANTIWGYCFKNSKIEKINCFDLAIRLQKSSANRHLEVLSYIHHTGFNSTTKYHRLIGVTSPYQHRKWNHYCISYSSITGENTIYWNGLKVASQVLKNDFRPVWKGNNNDYESAFIIGQDQDKIRGGYQRTQLFSGDIAEVNIWNHILNESDVKAMSQCRLFLQGNVKEWKLQNLRINKAALVENVSRHMYCAAQKQFLIFPRRQPFQKAKEACTMHGGKIVTPTSEKENELVLNIVKKHSKSCIEPGTSHKRNWGHIIWLGLKRINSTWYDMKGEEKIGEINFSRWVTESFKDDLECAFLGETGTWYFNNHGDCERQSLCTVCSIQNEPIFTLKGACWASDVDYNYYMNIDSKHEIYNFEGYKGNDVTKDFKGI